MATVFGAFMQGAFLDATGENLTSVSSTFDFSPAFAEVFLGLTRVAGLHDELSGSVELSITSLTTENPDGTPVDQPSASDTAMAAFDRVISVTWALSCVNGLGVGWARVLFWG